MTDDRMQQVRASLEIYHQWKEATNARPDAYYQALARLAQLCDLEFNSGYEQPPDPPFLQRLAFEIPQPVLPNGPLMYSQPSDDGVRMWVYTAHGGFTVQFATDAEQAKSDMSIGPGIVKTRRDMLDLIRLYKIPTVKKPTLEELKKKAEEVRKTCGRFEDFEDWMEAGRKLFAYIDLLEAEKAKVYGWREVQVIGYEGHEFGIRKDRDGVLIITTKIPGGPWAHGIEPEPGKHLRILEGYTRYTVTDDEKCRSS